MTTDELIKALRTKPSRDNRELLDEAADKLEAYYYHTCGHINENTCVICGAVIPEGRQICPDCEEKARNGGKFE